MIYDVCFGRLLVSGDGSQIVSVGTPSSTSDDRSVEVAVLDAATGTRLLQTTVAFDTAYAIAGTVDGSQLIVHLPSGLAAYKLASNSVELILPNEATKGLLEAVVAPDGSAIYAFDAAGMLWHLDARSYAMVAQVDFEIVLEQFADVQLRVKPDSTAVAVHTQIQPQDASDSYSYDGPDDVLFMYNSETQTFSSQILELASVSSAFWWSNTGLFILADTYQWRWSRADNKLYTVSTALADLSRWDLHAIVPAFDVPAVADHAPFVVEKPPTIHTPSATPVPITQPDSTPFVWLAHDAIPSDGYRVRAVAPDGSHAIVHQHTLAVLQRPDQVPLLVTRDGQTQTLYMFDPTTNITVTLPFQADVAKWKYLDTKKYAFAPDSSQLALVLNPHQYDPLPDDEITGFEQVVVIDLATGSTRALFTTRDYPDLQGTRIAAWNAEGLWLAAEQPGVWHINPAAAQAPTEIWTTLSGYTLDVSIEHELLVYGQADEADQHTLYLVNWRTGATATIATKIPSTLWYGSWFVRITPDGRKVLWTRGHKADAFVGDLLLYDRATQENQVVWHNLTTAIRPEPLINQLASTNTRYYIWKPYMGLAFHEQPVLELDLATGAATFPVIEPYISSFGSSCYIAYDQLTCLNISRSSWELHQQPLEARTPTIRLYTSNEAAMLDSEVLYIAP